MPRSTHAKAKCELLSGETIYWDSHEMITDQGELVTNDRLASIWLLKQRHEGFYVVWTYWKNETVPRSSICKAKLLRSTREWLQKHWHPQPKALHRHNLQYAQVTRGARCSGHTAEYYILWSTYVMIQDYFETEISIKLTVTITA